MVRAQGTRRGLAEERKRTRLDIRASVAQKALIDRAAALEGRSVSEYVLTHVQPAAEQAIQRHQVIALSVRDSVRFVDALLNPPEPNARLRAAWSDYEESRDGQV